MLNGVKFAAGLIACSALAQPVFADQPLETPPYWQGMQPVGRAVLGQLRASGRPGEVHPPRHEIAVILWDEPKTPRPGGNKLDSASTRTDTIYLTMRIVGYAP
jgi:hypothetical protein